jgi:uncharacterized coiled-coil protein SlyX
MLVLSLEDPAVAGAGWALLATGASVVVNWLSWGRRLKQSIAAEAVTEQERTVRLGVALDDWQQRVVGSMTEIETRMQSQMVQLNANQQQLANLVMERSGNEDRIIDAINLLQTGADAAGGARVQHEQALLELSARIDKQAKILGELAQLQQQVMDPRADNLAELTGRLESVQQEFMSRQAARNGGTPGGAGQPIRRS